MAKRKGTFSPELRKEIIAFIDKFNAENGHGGVTVAQKKYKFSRPSLMEWRKQLGIPSPGKGKPTLKKTQALKAKAAKKPAVPTVKAGKPKAVRARVGKTRGRRKAVRAAITAAPAFDVQSMRRSFNTILVCEKKISALQEKINQEKRKLATVL